MPLTATQTLGAGAAIKSEASGARSREAITIPSGVGLVLAGTVLGKYTSGANTGKVGLYDNDATDGRQTVYGVLLADANATSAGPTYPLGCFTAGCHRRSPSTGGITQCLLSRYCSATSLSVWQSRQNARPQSLSVWCFLSVALTGLMLGTRGTAPRSGRWYST